jgi:hypothetical protein
MILTRYWFEFDLSVSQAQILGVLLGCGVTAYSHEDALAIIKERIFKNDLLPPIKSVIENIDVSTLDFNHIQPNMGLTVKRGIWFPRGYS